jgi:hypothetical protein
MGRLDARHAEAILKVHVTATTTATTEVRIEPRVITMLKARFEEHVRLAAEIKERKARQERIQGEVEELFVKAEQEAALAEGTAIDGYKVKRVCGTSRKLDTMALITALDITPEELNAFYEEKANRPYIRISAPGQKDRDE